MVNIVEQKRICYNCFKELKESETICDSCGYDASGERERFPMALMPGTILAGKYIVGRVLGQGGFGITYVAQDYQTGQLVAMKEFFPDTMASRTAGSKIQAHTGATGDNFVYGKDCFLEEAKTLAEFIGNENIVRVISYFEENGTAYFAMEYIEGESFQDYIKSHGGKVSWEEATKFLLPVMDALAAVHSKGIVHRDVTPDNIYITKEGIVKLLDFGAARYSLGDKSRSLDVVLKHGFAPKEQYTRHGKQGPFTDVYTVAASFYFALTGKKTPDAIDRMDEDDLVPPSSLGVSLPVHAEDAILKALNVQPQDRFQSMTEFKNALLGTAASTPVSGSVQASASGSVQAPVNEVRHATEQAPQEGNGSSTAPAAKDRKIWVVLTGICGIIILLIVIIILLISGDKSDTESALPSNVVVGEPEAQPQQPAQSGTQNEIVDQSTTTDPGVTADEPEEAEAADEAETSGEEYDSDEPEEEETDEPEKDLVDMLDLTEESENYYAAVEEADYEWQVYTPDGEVAETYPKFKIHYSDYIYNQAWSYDGASYTPAYGENVHTVVFSGAESSLTATIATDPKNRSREKLLKEIKSDAKSQGYNRYGVLWDDKDDNGLFVDSFADGIILVHRTFRVYDGYYMLQEIRVPQYFDEDDAAYKSYYAECIYRLCSFNANGKEPRDFGEYWEKNESYLSSLDYPYPN